MQFTLKLKLEELVRSRTTLSLFTCASPPSQHLSRYFGHHQQRWCGSLTKQKVPSESTPGELLSWYWLSLLLKCSTKDNIGSSFGVGGAGQNGELSADCRYIGDCGSAYASGRSILNGSWRRANAKGASAMILSAMNEECNDSDANMIIWDEGRTQASKHQQCGQVE
jgi:hypothetical protein